MPIITIAANKRDSMIDAALRDQGVGESGFLSGLEHAGAENDAG